MVTTPLTGWKATLTHQAIAVTVPHARQTRRARHEAKRQRSRNNHGPRIAFEEHPARSETAWLESNTVVINSGHSAYRQRINQDQARLTYCMFAIGVALDKADLVESNNGISYVDKFISAWGGNQ